MTNKEDEEQSCDPRVAALLAVHLVSQVLDEAYVIANAAKDSGHPWRYVSSLKKIRNYHFDETCEEEDLTFTVSRDDSQYDDENNNNGEANVVTSTPQKGEGNIAKSKNEASFLGQGNVEFEVKNNELRKSTSMFINHLFDMSDVEHIVICDEPDDLNNNLLYTTITDTDDIQTITKMIEFCVDTALERVLSQKYIDQNPEDSDKCSDNTGNSSYSFLVDAFDVDKDMVEEKIIPDVKINYNQDIPQTSYNKPNESGDSHNTDTDTINQNDIAMYESAYLSLNRDYDQYSEEEEPILQDPKGMALQEVELITANSSTENISPKNQTSHENKTFAAISGVSTSASRKSSLARRCRIQGARLLSCLRGWWWRRKLNGKRKEYRTPRSSHGLCPLSPDARRRTASLIDQRSLRSPSPSKSVVWKFNTVNEALVHSSRWKEFGYKMSLNENDEF